MKGNVIKRRQPICITEAHLFVANIARNARRRFTVYPTGLDPFIKNFKNTFACGASSLHKLVELMQPADWIVKKCREHKERDQIADLHPTRQDGATPKPKNQYGAKRLEHRHRGAVNGPNPHNYEGGVAQLIAHPIEPPMLFVLAHEAFDLANPGKIIVQQRVHG